MTKLDGLDLLEGDLLKSIFKLGFPVAMSSLLHMFYSVADTYWLGKLGKEAISAPVISYMITFFVFSIGMGFSTAGVSLVAQYVGAKQKEKAHQTAGNLLTYLILISALFGGLGVLLDEQLLMLFKTPPDAFDQTRSYYRLIMMGMPLAFPIFVYQSVMQGYGDTVSPFKIELITSVINVVLDPILIFGWFGFPAMGVRGAALATVITRGLASLIGVYFFFSGKKGIKLKLCHLKPDFKLLPLIFKIGMPFTVGMTGSSLGFIVLMRIINMFGTVAISGYGIVMQVINFFMLPAIGISAAVTTIVGQNLGAGKIKRAKAVVAKGVSLTIALLLPSVIFMAIFGKQLTAFFLPGDPVSHQAGQTMFYICSPSLIFLGLFTVLESPFHGAGFTIPSMVASLAKIWLFRLPFVYIISMVLLKGPGNPGASVGIWWGILISNFGTFLLIFTWYMKGSWAKPLIRHKS